MHRDDQRVCDLRRLERCVVSRRPQQARIARRAVRCLRPRRGQPAAQLVAAERATVGLEIEDGPAVWGRRAGQSDPGSLHKRLCRRQREVVCTQQIVHVGVERKARPLESERCEWGELGRRGRRSGSRGAIPRSGDQERRLGCYLGGWVLGRAPGGGGHDDIDAG